MISNWEKLKKIKFFVVKQFKTFKDDNFFNIIDQIKMLKLLS